MELTLPYELIQSIEQVFGKEKTGEFVKLYEKYSETFVKKADELALQKKLELKDELTKELATKSDLLLIKAEMQLFRSELDSKIDETRIGLDSKIDKTRIYLDSKIDETRIGLDSKIDETRIGLDSKIDETRIGLDSKIDETRIGLDSKIDKVDMKLTMRLNLLIILMIIALTLMNPVVAKIISNWLKLGL